MFIPLVDGRWCAAIDPSALFVIIGLCKALLFSPLGKTQCAAK